MNETNTTILTDQVKIITFFDRKNKKQRETYFTEGFADLKKKI